MPEIPGPNEQQPSPEQAVLQESFARFEQANLELAKHIPEVVERPEITEAGKELIEEFALKPSLFDSEDRAVVFAGIASRWVTAKESGDESEKAFVADTLALLAHEHSDTLTAAHELIKSEDPEFDDDTRERVYDDYTDKELTAAVSQAIENGLLDDVKQKLGITAENENPYVIRVLSIADETQLHGLDAPKPDFTLPYNSDGVQDAIQLQDDVKAWKRGLEARTKEFANKIGREGAFGPAWMTEINGVRNLCISSALAEKIRDPEVTKNTGWYTERNIAGDFATLEHEYVHTQGGVMADRSISFGINLEELRAEYFSGNKQGYQDVKGFFQAYAIITGQNMSKELASRTKGGSVAEAFGAIANRVGLSTMLEVMVASPKNYDADQGNTFRREAFNHVGGLDGILERLYKVEVASGNESMIAERIDQGAQMLLNSASNVPDLPNFLNFYENYRKNDGLGFMTEKLVARAKELRRVSGE